VNDPAPFLALLDQKYRFGHAFGQTQLPLKHITNSLNRSVAQQK
jgi:hypothetical protein